MKILLVHYRYFLSGGPESYLFKLQELLTRQGHEVLILSSQDPRNRPCPQDRYFVGSRGGDVKFRNIRLTPGNVLRLLKGAFYNPEAARNLSRLIDDERPEAVLVLQQINLLSPSVFIAAKRKGLRVVHRLSDYNLFCPRFDFLRQRKTCERCLSGSRWNAVRYRCVHGSAAASFIRVLSMVVHQLLRAFDRIDTFVVTNRFMERKLLESGVAPKRIRCIPTFIDFSGIQPTYRHDGYVLLLGRFSMEKGPDYAVEAMAHLRDLDLNLVVTGSLEEDDSGLIARLIQAHHLQDRVTFAGFVEGADLSRLIGNALCVLCPAIVYDNLPNTIPEAFAHGKPVIASNHGCFPEVIEPDRTGLLFEPKNSRDLARQIRRLYSEPGLAEQMGRNARLTCEREFAPEIHLRRLLAALQGEPEPAEQA